MNYEMQKTEQSIFHQLKALLALFNDCKVLKEERMQYTAKSTTLEANNKDYSERLGDRRGNTRTNFYLIIAVLTIFIDLFILHSSLKALSDERGWSPVIQFLFPLLLVIIEILVSYSIVIKLQEGEPLNWVQRNLQYFAIGIIIGLSILTIFYTAQGYDATIDTLSFETYMAIAILVQAVLLTASVMLHLWIIKNAEEIADAIAYFLFRRERNKTERNLDTCEHMIKESYALFITNVQRVVRDIEQFKARYPESLTDFGKMVPVELAVAVNKVMGRIVFIVLYDEVGMHHSNNHE